MKHIDIFRKTQEEEGLVMVLEDDAIFVENYHQQLDACLLCLPTQWDVLFVGGCCNLHADVSTIWSPLSSSRGTCGYIINKN